MPGYKRFLVDQEGASTPLEIKLNQQDGFVRLSGPLHEVFQVRRRPALPMQATIANVYGAALFTVQHPLNEYNSYTASIDAHSKLQLVFGGQSRLKVYLQNAGDARGAEEMFYIQDDGAPLNDGEKEMLAAAVALCLMRSESSGRRQSSKLMA
jgi:hypothetical protein